ncbi:unnamed protein product [Rotaria sp. Silwood1]|nr:unnamed protein product [Rotaria sp. Silwood1]CAF1678305.1 unnamed protein product [Rotaria sp. Silwood1]CAF3591829.1 unnamed protein product [Rotaria sp. Silwood1]
MTSASSTTTDEVNRSFTVDDVSDPNIVLRPIEGYQSMMILSLEEATKTVASLFRNLERKTIKTYSYYQYEDKILLLPGTYLEVIGKAKLAEGLHIIRMREINPPHVLLEPPIDFETTQNIEFILDSVYEVNNENDNVPKLFII